MIYLDTSCLLKLLWEEPESADVRRAVDSEVEVVVSSLTELETEVQLKAAATGGVIRATQWRQYQVRLSAMRNLDPFHFRYLPAAVFSTALRQHRRPQAAYCRSLDRLHLAAMEELKLKRLMTLDRIQGKAAEAQDYEGTLPGLEVNGTGRSSGRFTQLGGSSPFFYRPSSTWLSSDWPLGCVSIMAAEPFPGGCPRP